MMFLFAGHSAGLLNNNHVQLKLPWLLESQLHGSRRKSYLSVPFFFHLRYEWLVRGRLYLPNLRLNCTTESAIYVMELTVRGGVPILGSTARNSDWWFFIDTILRLLYTNPTSKSQTNDSYDYEKFIIVIILNNVSVCRSKTWYKVEDMISKFIAGSAGDSILMNNSMQGAFDLTDVFAYPLM